MLVCRLLRPGSKLRVERELGTAGQSTLAALLDVRNASADDLYQAMDWLAPRQHAIERKLAAAHLDGAPLVLYDVSSSYLEGSRCELAARGYSRDHRGDRPQIVYGLLCSPEGCPVAVQAFAGNTADPADQVRALRERFGLRRVALVGDRGMIAQTRIDERPQAGRLRLDHRPAQRHDPERHPARPVRRGLASVNSGRGLPRRAPGWCVSTRWWRPRSGMLRGGALHSRQVRPGRVQPAPGRAAATQDGQALRMDVRGGHGGVFLAAEGRVDPGREAPDGIYVIRTSLEQERWGTARRWRRTRAWRGSSARSAQ